MFILILLILFSTIASPYTMLVSAFLSGLLIDLWHGERLGITSLLFLCTVFLLTIYKRKFNPEHLVFLLPFTFLTVLATSWIEMDMKLPRMVAIDRILQSGTLVIILWIGIRLWHRFVKKTTSA